MGLKSLTGVAGGSAMSTIVGIGLLLVEITSIQCSCTAVALGSSTVFAFWGLCFLQSVWLPEQTFGSEVLKGLDVQRLCANVSNILL